MTPLSIEEILAEDDPTGELSRPKGGGGQPLPSSSYTRPPETDLIERAKRYVAKMPHAVQGRNGSGATYAVATVLVHGFDLPPDVALSLLATEYNPRCEPTWSDAELRHKVDDALTKGHHQPKGWLLADDALNLSPSPPRTSPPPVVGQEKEYRGPGEADDPHRLAGSFLARKEYEHLRSYREEFVEWKDGAYRDVKNGDVKAPLTNWIHSEFLKAHKFAAEEHAKAGEDGKDPPKLRQVTVSLVNNVVNAIRGSRHVRSSVDAPSWIDGATGPEPRNIVAVRNGLYDIAADVLLPHSPQYFTFSAAPFDYDPAAPEPVQWLKFLRELWPTDPDSIACLQEWFGYLLTPDTRQQKLLFLLGPKRAGKGTIARVLKELVGPLNLAGPTLNGLTLPFGLEPLLGKSVALIDDARLGPRADASTLTERINTITGEGTIGVDRKHKDTVTTKLTTRFVIVSNELPRIVDSSSALSSRFILLRLNRSFYGKEDTGLTERLLTELPGILRWAIAGWRRLAGRKKFVQPAEGKQSLKEMDDIGSPVGAFVREKCITTDTWATIDRQELYDEWKRWSEESGRRDPGTKQVFGRDLAAVVAGLRTSHVRRSGNQIRMYVGIRLKKEHDFDVDDEEPNPLQPATCSNTLHTSREEEKNIDIEYGIQCPATCSSVEQGEGTQEIGGAL